MTDFESVGDQPISILLGGEVARTTPDATLYEVAAVLSRDDIGALVVDDNDDEATAVVTERDLVRALAGHADPAEMKVHQIASTELIWCDITSPVAEVAALMVQEYVRHVLVEDDGELVGIVSSRDVLGLYCASEPELS